MKKSFTLLLLVIVMMLSVSYGCLLRPNDTEQHTSGPIQTPQDGQATTALPGAPMDRTLPAVDVPVLYYHLINDNLYGPYPSMFVSPGEFDKQMNYLKSNGYTVIGLDEIEQAARYAKPVIITFDDGYEDNYTNAYPILKKYNFKATVFLISSFMGKPGYLNEGQIHEMQDLISFQSHTITHSYLTRLSAEEVDHELAESKRVIEALTGDRVDALAYPIGDYNQQVIEITRRYYKYAVLMVPGGFYHTGDDPYQIKRLNIQRGMTVDDFARKIQGSPE